MRILREWLHRLVATFRPGRRDDDLAEEIRVHAALAAESGRRESGAAQAMEALRDQRGLPWLDDLGRDLRYGLRTLARSKGFTVTALISLAWASAPTPASSRCSIRCCRGRCRYTSLSGWCNCAGTAAPSAQTMASAAWCPIRCAWSSLSSVRFSTASSAAIPTL